MKIITLPSGHEVKVDDDVYEWASKSKWHIDSKGYARTPKSIYLHKLVIDCPKGMQRDHINGDRLDSRRENLRIATPAENARNRKIGKNNTSGYKGVRLEAGKYWRAFFSFNGKKTHLGYFPTAEDAARAWDNVAKIVHGKFAKLNFKK